MSKKALIVLSVVFMLLAISAGVAVAGSVSLQQAIGLINQQPDLEGQSKVFHGLPAETQQQIEDTYKIDPSSGQEETIYEDSGPVRQKDNTSTTVGMLEELQATTVANVASGEKHRGQALMNDVLAKVNKAAKAAGKGQEAQARSDAELKAFKALSKSDQELLKKACTISADYRDETWYYKSADSAVPDKIVVEVDTLHPEAVGIAFRKALTADDVVLVATQYYSKIVKVRYKYTMLGFKALGDFRRYWWNYYPGVMISWVGGNYSWGEAYAPFINYDSSATVVSKSGGVGYKTYYTLLKRHWWQGLGASDGWGSITWANAYIWHEGTQDNYGRLSYTQGG